MKAIKQISIMIKQRKEINRLQQEEKFKKGRENTLKQLDHTWNKEEYDEYNEAFFTAAQGNVGPFTAAEYQLRLLWIKRGYFTKNEIDKLNKSIQIRLLEEKRKELISQSVSHQLMAVDKKIKALNNIK